MKPAERLARLEALYGKEMAEAIVDGRPERPPLADALGRVRAGRNPDYDPTATPQRLALGRIAPKNVRDDDVLPDPIVSAVREALRRELYPLYVALGHVVGDDSSS